MCDSNHSELQNIYEQLLVISAMIIILIWDKNQITQYIDELNQHIIKYVDVNLFTMSKNDLLNINFRHYVNDEQWRNKVRRQLTLSVLRLKFANIVIHHVKIIKSIFTDKLIMFWTRILDWLKKLFAKFKVAVVYTLKIIRTNNYFFEYKNVSLTIVEIIEVNTIKNIVFKKSNHYIDIKNSSTDSITIKKDFDNIVKEQKND